MHTAAKVAEAILSGGFFFIGLILPIITFCFLRRRFPQRHGSNKTASVVAAWILLCAYMFLTTPLRIACRMNLDDPNSEMYGMWDGVGENSATLVLGWILPVIALFLFSALTSIFRSDRKPTNESPVE